ncbi:M24 family metallopeptidase [Candidatus Nitrospira nitrificans]|uniref:Xaa-Pro aminopeptidase n=1 Tax=Candidatus Nitrospira nitrificans TaxID=1742973 RepID=A0A0S4LMW6_9BACT|nr:Xaa-Pro peptidase family protein [Candidatus Nitrospira nitrificans]CUS38090.1 Xaa-Pro aminopeptidase [Candidatus Nitrospira nitrificans]
MKRTTTPQAEVATLFIAASELDSNLYYATRFMAPDPFIYLEIKGERVMVMSDLEMDRARTQASVDRVLSYSDIEQKAKKQGIKDPTAVDIVHVVLKESKIRRLSVPANFPIIHAARLQERGYSLKPKRDPFYEQRVVKTAEEVRHIEDAQRATEEAVAAAHAMLRRAEVKDEQLWLDGAVVTSERIKKLVNVKLMERDCIAQHTIVAGGEQACDPHNEGTGPLPAHRSIIFDVFPRSATSRYFADMSRTVIRGKASVELKRLYGVVKDAQEDAIDKIKDGADGMKIHQGICARFEKAGYKTGLVNGRMQGYFHGTGHGVGLDIHEAPRISRTGSLLQEGHVVTVEPGLYYPGLGAVRIEDMVLVTKDGCRNLTNFQKVFELG